MNKKETAEIVKLMNAYFRNTGSATVATLIDAWHEALKDEDFHRTRKAVVRFAKNDRRDYPTWPAVGQIIAAIAEEKKAEDRPANLAYNAIFEGRDYEELPQEVRDRLAPEIYMAIQRLDPDTQVQRSREILARLKVEMRREQ